MLKRFNFQILAIVWLIIITISTHIHATSQTTTNPSNKIYSVITNTLGEIKSHGINFKNVHALDVVKEYNSLMTLFDESGRLGLNIDVTDISAGLISKLNSIGCDIRLIIEESKLISAYAPIDKIEEIATWDDVKIIRPIMLGVTNTGSVTSEGDSIHHAREVRNDLNVTGDSVKVGVISDGCTNWLASQRSVIYRFCLDRHILPSHFPLLFKSVQVMKAQRCWK